ncbi:MAG: polyprenyl synthetase family protein [Thermoanaerobaculia bacterium]|nr:polyprenyl synthetase family protein [Thermoanaerobaculia bacterium]
MDKHFLIRRELVNARLVKLAAEASAPHVLRAPLEKAITSPGKRVRGVLTMTVGEALGARGDKLLDAAAAFELIHASSLILDDLPSMDDAELRRGEPTLHRAFGEDLAILAAVALLNQSYTLVAASHAALKPRRWPLAAVIDRVVRAVGWDGTIAGEAVDLHCEAETLDFHTLEYIHSRKTGALFVASAAVGAMLAGASDAMLGSVEAYAKNLGLAFQITDDILDATSSPDVLGKDVGKDEGKLTFVRLAGVDGARQLNRELIDTSIRAIAPLGSAAEPLRALATMLRDRTS